MECERRIWVRVRLDSRKKRSGEVNASVATSNIFSCRIDRDFREVCGWSCLTGVRIGGKQEGFWLEALVVRGMFRADILIALCQYNNHKYLQLCNNHKSPI